MILVALTIYQWMILVVSQIWAVHQMLGLLQTWAAVLHYLLLHPQVKRIGVTILPPH
jgi:hypothetical protein